MYDYQSDVFKRKSIIEGLVEAKKLKEVIYLVNEIIKNNQDQISLNILIQDLPMLLEFQKSDLNNFLNISLEEEFKLLTND